MSTRRDRESILAAVRQVGTCADVRQVVQRLAADPPALVDRILRSPEWSLVAVYRGSVIGHIGCLQDEMLGLIASHVVLPAYRGFGVGGRLLGELVVLARNEGLRLVEALLRPALPRVCRLYEHHGFRQAGAASNDGWVRYERRLDGPT